MLWPSRVSDESFQASLNEQQRDGLIDQLLEKGCLDENGIVQDNFAMAYRPSDLAVEIFGDVGIRAEHADGKFSPWDETLD